MAKKELSQHSNYHVFQVLQEGDNVVLRAKQFLFSPEWVPACGIKLLKEQGEGDIPPSEVAEFRVDHLNLNQGSQDLQRFYMTIDLQKRMKVQSSYDRLRKKLVIAKSCKYL